MSLYIKILNKIKRLAKTGLEYFNLYKIIGTYYIKKINQAEYKNPPFSLFNERPVEYCFVFEQISKYYPKKILDVGTGVTALPHLMANCGLQVSAIDNIKDYWPNGMFNRHYKIIDDDITKTKIKDKFDMITCISVLEHIDQYDQAVKSMFDLLNPNGLLVLTFPYEEESFIDNVYTVTGSNVKSLPQHKTHSFSRKEINNWLTANQASIVNQEYWQFFTGKCWTVGDRLPIPKKVNRDEKHQISCLVIQKKI